MSRRQELPARWQDVVERYQRQLASASRAKVSVGAQVQVVGRFAIACGDVAPEVVTTQLLREYLGQGTWARSTREGVRRALVRFYAWMHHVQLLELDPAAELAVAPAPPLPPLPWRVPLRDYRRWLAQQGRSPATVVDYTGFVERFARRDGDHGPWRVTSTHVEAWLAAGRQAGWSPGTARTTRSRLGAFYTWAMDAGWTTRNPCDELSQRLRRREPPATWRQTLDQYEQHLLSRGLTLVTVERRLADLGRFAWTVSTRPWQVSTEQAHAWLTREEVNQVTADRLRSTLHGFYAWGQATGRVRVSPLQPLSQRLVVRQAAGAWAKAVEAWMVHLQSKGLSPGTLKTRRSHLRALAARHPGCSPWTMDLERLTVFMATPGWGQEHRKNIRSTLVGFYGWAERAGKVKRSPAATLPGVRVPRAQPRPIAEEDLRATLRDTAAAHPREHLMLLLARYAGLRAGEIASLHSRDVEVVQRPDGSWHGRMTITGKGGDQRVVPMLPDLAAAVVAYLDGRDGYAFPGPGKGHLSNQYVSMLLSRRLGPRWTVHTLRHRFGTNAYGATSDLRAVQELLGHASPATTARYTAVADRAMLAAVLAAADDLDDEAARQVS